MDPFCQHWLTFIPAWINNYIHPKVWDEITYLFPNLNGAAVKVWEWIIISAHTSLGMWLTLLIHAGIKVNVKSSFSLQFSMHEHYTCILHLTIRKMIVVFTQSKPEQNCNIEEPIFKCILFNGHVCMITELHAMEVCGIMHIKHTDGVMVWKHFPHDCSPDSKVHGVNMGPIWGRQDPGGPQVGPMNLAIWVSLCVMRSFDIYLALVWTSCWTNDQIAGDFLRHHSQVTSL